MKAEDIDAVEAREYARLTGIPRLVAALRDAQAELASLKVQQAELAVEVGDLTRDEQAYHDRALTAEAQVAAVLALCDQADARLGQGNSLTPTAVRAAVDGAL